jgi:hypothetical protein
MRSTDRTTAVCALVCRLVPGVRARVLRYTWRYTRIHFSHSGSKASAKSSVVSCADVLQECPGRGGARGLAAARPARPTPSTPILQPPTRVIPSSVIIQMDGTIASHSAVKRTTMILDSHSARKTIHVTSHHDMMIAADLPKAPQSAPLYLNVQGLQYPRGTSRIIIIITSPSIGGSRR